MNTSIADSDGDEPEERREAKVTLEEMRRSDKVMLSPADVSGVLKCHPYSINVQAKEDITKLPFPCFMLGTRVRIPRTAFIEWCELMKIGAQPRELKRR